MSVVLIGPMKSMETDDKATLVNRHSIPWEDINKYCCKQISFFNVTYLMGILLCDRNLCDFLLNQLKAFSFKTSNCSHSQGQNTYYRAC